MPEAGVTPPMHLYALWAGVGYALRAEMTPYPKCIQASDGESKLLPSKNGPTRLYIIGLVASA
eukprot:470434-Karenia_brevis.AAC.1